MSSRGRFLTFRSLVRQWTPVTENEIHVVLDLCLIMWIIQKPTLRTYFSRKRILSTPGFGDVMSRDRFQLIMKFLHFADNVNKANYKGPAQYTIYFLFYCTRTMNFRTYSRAEHFSRRIPYYGRDSFLSNNIYH
jgi:hypothetical protein